MRACISIIGVLITCALANAATVDPRAVEHCNAKHESFVAVEECLADAHVALVLLDALVRERFLGPEAGHDLIARCNSRNPDDLVGTWICSREAVAAAVRLGSKLPEGSKIDDPLFAPLNRPELPGKLQEAEKSAQNLFPEKSVWGLNMYFPLK